MLFKFNLVLFLILVFCMYFHIFVSFTVCLSSFQIVWFSSDQSVSVAIYMISRSIFGYLYYLSAVVDSSLVICRFPFKIRYSHDGIYNSLSSSTNIIYCILIYCATHIMIAVCFVSHYFSFICKTVCLTHFFQNMEILDLGM